MPVLLFIKALGFCGWWVLLVVFCFFFLSILGQSALSSGLIWGALG